MPRVGVAVVHGVGEQRRFEHLDSQVRGLIAALRARPGAIVTVEPRASPAAAFQAQQDTWDAGWRGALRILVRESGRPDTEIIVHEVWWADVNETYSLGKQLRFWLWGPAIWTLPRKRSSVTPVARTMYALPLGIAGPLWWFRLKLFFVCNLFLAGSLTIGVALVLAKRLLDIEGPDVVATFVNYLSCIKLYNEKRRHAPGILPADGDFLDALGEPPRVSVRRRMVRTIADMALARYDRWYVLGHSHGSVVAFNALMEPAYNFPSYLDEARWRRLVHRGLAGPGPAALVPPAPPREPSRPLWLARNDMAYRARIFETFGGLLTYGSPLGKFAAIWPARVWICQEPAFPAAAQWLNVFDPLDPISGPLDAYQNPVFWAGVPPTNLTCCPPLRSIGYTPAEWPFVGHLHYFDHTPGPVTLADVAADIFMAGIWTQPPLQGRFFPENGAADAYRSRLIGLWWGVAGLVVTALLVLLIGPEIRLIRSMIVLVGGLFK